jgi:hypothetical protein
MVVSRRFARTNAIFDVRRSVGEKQHSFSMVVEAAKFW